MEFIATLKIACSKLPGKQPSWNEGMDGLNTPFFAPFLASFFALFLASLFGDCYARMAAMRIFVMVECNAGSGWKNSIPHIQHM